MPIDKTLLSGSTSLLVLKLLEDGDKYGYQMIEELRRRSDETFSLKAGTLYPLLHALEQRGDITAWEESSDTARPRRYYHLTEAGRARLAEKETEWRAYAGAMLRVLEGGAGLV
ncbi:MAG: helix-turn-helix transcriptional regulator [Oscillospiraceae bacterium]|nr:helix-turn-helix transcriptional regulator [Oscillospiraceae bacterium]